MEKVTMYYKGYCPFCKRAKALFDELGTPVNMIDIEGDNALRNEMIKKANGGSTVPQIFIGGKHIGGCDDLMALHAQGELKGML